MKQHIFKQNLLTKLMAITLVIAMVIVAACNKEYFNSQTVDNNIVNEVSKTDAQQWFENQQIASTSKFLKEMKPVWESAITEGGVMYVPIQYDSGRHIIPSLYKGTANLGREKLIFYEKNGKYTSNVVYFLPTKSFRGNVDLINFFNFKEQKFDGTIITRNLEGEHMRAFKVSNGNVTKKQFNPKVIKADNIPDGEYKCDKYYVWKCTTTPGCCCEDCELVEKEDCWYDGTGDVDCPSPDPSCPSDGCPGPYPWCADQNTGGSGGGSTDNSVRAKKVTWIKTHKLGAIENVLLNNNALYGAVFRFIENYGDATIYAPIVINYLLNESSLTLIAEHLKLLVGNAGYFTENQQEGFTVTAMNRTLKSQVLDGSGTLNSGTCAESFLYIRVGDGFTTGVKGMGHAYLKNFTWYDVCISNMCIQVRGKDQFNQPLTADKAAELTAYAFDNARLEMFEDLNNVITTSEQARNLYKTYVQDELAKLTGYRGSCSISYGECSGNVPAEFYYLKGLLTGFQCYHTGRCP
jgi:hypothetical protein